MFIKYFIDTIFLGINVNNSELFSIFSPLNSDKSSDDSYGYITYDNDLPKLAFDNSEAQYNVICELNLPSSKTAITFDEIENLLKRDYLSCRSFIALPATIYKHFKFILLMCIK